MGQHEFDESLIESNERALENQWLTAKPLKFSVQRDVPMLLYVRNSTFVSNEQMCREFLETKREVNRRCFSWRMQRLIDSNLISVIPEQVPYKGRVYTITRYGLQVLESCGEGLQQLTSGSRTLPNKRQAPHFLELNDIRWALERTKCLRSWSSDCELTSRNYAVGSPYAKDYDAVAHLVLNGEVYKVAVEYERSLKGSARYKEIEKSIETEEQIDVVLYLGATLNNVMSLASEFISPTLPMCFACSWMFKEHTFSTNVVLRYGDMRESYSFRQALENIVLAIK